jgi:hypothetical protein
MGVDGGIVKKVTIQLTKKQKEILSPFFAEVMAAADGDPDLRMSILGQVWGDAEGDRVPAGAEPGTANFYLLTGEQFKIVNRAILRARKLK